MSKEAEPAEMPTSSLGAARTKMAPTRCSISDVSRSSWSWSSVLRSFRHQGKRTISGHSREEARGTDAQDVPRQIAYLSDARPLPREGGILEQEVVESVAALGYRVEELGRGQSVSSRGRAERSGAPT